MPVDDMFCGDRMGKFAIHLIWNGLWRNNVRDVSPDEIEQAVKQMAAGYFARSLTENDVSYWVKLKNKLISHILFVKNYPE